MPAERHVAVLSIHPLYDTRVAKHLVALVEHGDRVTYINRSREGDLPERPALARVKLVRRLADPAVGLNPLAYGAMLGWFLRAAVDAKADLYHLHDVVLLPLAPALRLLTRRPVVFDAHEHYHLEAGVRGAAYRWYYRLFLPFVAGVVSVSETTTPPGWPSRKPVAVVPNFQSRADFEPFMGSDAGGTRNEEAARPVTAIYFGSLYTEVTDIALMLDAAERVLSDAAAPAVRFEFGGKVQGPGGKRFVARFEGMARRFPGRFEWFGLMPRDEVIRRTAAADLGLWFVRTSSINAAGSAPNKVFEYMTVGAAVLASDAFAVAPRVREAGAGVVFPGGADAAAVAATITDLARDRARLGRMKHASAELGKSYTWEGVKGRVFELYERVTG